MEAGRLSLPTRLTLSPVAPSSQCHQLPKEAADQAMEMGKVGWGLGGEVVGGEQNPGTKNGRCEGDGGLAGWKGGGGIRAPRTRLCVC